MIIHHNIQQGLVTEQRPQIIENYSKTLENNLLVCSFKSYIERKNLSYLDSSIGKQL